MGDTETTRALVRQYIVDNFLYMRPGFEFTDDDALMGRGIVDSLGVMELIGFVEEAFGVAIAADDVTEEHFGSVNAMVRFVASKQTGVPERV
jgi:acyl carrier protein